MLSMIFWQPNMVGFKRNWAGRTIDEICAAPKPDYGPKVVLAGDARLRCVKAEGELTTAVFEGKKKDEIADIAKEQVRAEAYLGKRLAEKATASSLEMPG